MQVLPSGALYINSTRIGDSGDYTCVAENLAGYATRKVTLKIQGNYNNIDLTFVCICECTNNRKHQRK